jgi:hypothetical protein
MPNGISSYGRVIRIDQREDDTVEVHVQTDSFSPGQEVEVSVYLLQDDIYRLYNDKKHIPVPDPDNRKQPTVLKVQLPAIPLNAGRDVTVLTRVAQVWPTLLKPNSEIPSLYQRLEIDGPKAVWTPPDLSGKEPGDPESPAPSSGAAQGPASQP